MYETEAYCGTYLGGFRVPYSLAIQLTWWSSLLAAIFFLAYILEVRKVASQWGIVILLSPVLLVLTLIMAIFIIPVDIKSKGPKKIPNAYSGLHRIYEAEQNYKVKNGKYARTFSELQLTAEMLSETSTNKDEDLYAFFLSENESVQPPGLKQPYKIPKPYSAFVEDDRFQAVAVMNFECNSKSAVLAINQKKDLWHLTLRDERNICLYPKICQICDRDYFAWLFP